ncbi:uncharacterized protein LOC124449255 [Xenia sp. Carnegie-2017]|uniref:uncharacterized protein LOC124449255 n=1 Tax=Xenia sp. Carnegie-2017 TaxID=2897299 RepID=UPI001F04A3A2|nr:uncharacterized protein LOC124449255 [Xenia sp. Carnegie-2017]
MLKDNIERLRAKRGGYRGVCTRLVKEALELLDATEVDIERCNVIAEQLECKMKILDEINDEIIGICDVTDIEHEIEEAAAVSDRILSTRRKIKGARKPEICQETIKRRQSPTPQVEQIPLVVATASTSNTTISNDENNTYADAVNTNTNAVNTNTNAVNTNTNAVNTNTNTVYTNTNAIDTITNEVINANSTILNAPVRTTPAIMMPKLPKLQLPKFSGKITEWNAFWDLYNATIHSNESMSKCSTFDKGLTLTSANYDAAIAILQDRFGRTQQVIAAHMDQILQISACSENRTGQLRYVFDQISVQVRGLDSLGVSANQYGSLLIPIIMSKLPSEIRLQVARKATGDVWQIEELLKTIKFEVEAREMSESSRSIEKPQNKDKPNKPSTAGTFVVTKNDKDGAHSFKVKCVYCQGSHYSASCEEVKGREARVKILRDSNRCFICLKKGHQANKCIVTRKCRHCSGRHHQSICSYPATNSQGVQNEKAIDNTYPQKVSEGVNSPTTTAVTRTVKGSVLLQTARALVSNGSKSVPARILFDTGSQRSYIRRSLQGRLRLNSIGKETLQLNTFGQGKSKRESCEVFKVSIANKSGGEVVEIKAIEFPTICAPLPTRINIDDYPHLHGLELADFDSSDNNGSCDSIDILIGADHYWDVVTGDVVQGENGPTAMSSKLGWLLSGWSSQKSDEHTLNSLILAADCLDNSTVVTDRDELTISLKRFWETENVGIDSFDSENSTEEQDFVRNIQFTGTRYEVGLPWKNDHVQIDDDYELCHNRLRSLHRKLLKDPQNLEEYNNGITEQLAAGIVERVPASDKDCGKIHYLPHHCVIRKDKVTTKLRVVYDGSATTNLRKFSLNDCLLTGRTSFHKSLICSSNFDKTRLG